MDEGEKKQVRRVDRSKLFSESVPAVDLGNDADALAALQKYFEDDDFESFADTTPSRSVLPDDNSAVAIEGAEFNLFSTEDGTRKVSLSEPKLDVPLVNQRRPSDYYFITPDDHERIAKLMSVAVTASQILESSQRPYPAKQNPRLLTAIPANPQKLRKRRKPSKKERDYKKKMKLEEEERRLKHQHRYEKYLKYGRGQGG